MISNPENLNKEKRKAKYMKALKESAVDTSFEEVREKDGGKEEINKSGEKDIELQKEDEEIKNLKEKTERINQEIEEKMNDIEKQEQEDVDFKKKEEEYFKNFRRKKKDKIIKSKEDKKEDDGYLNYQKKNGKSKERETTKVVSKLLLDVLEHDKNNNIGTKKEQEINYEKNLEDAREKYIQEYKKCKNESDRQNLIIKTKNSIFNIFKSKENKKDVKVEDFFTDKFRESKKEYDQARIEMGNKMYENKKNELEKQGLSGEELQKALVNYKATEIIAKTIIDERQKIIDSKIKNPSRFNKLLDGYRKMPRWQRVALSTALFTAAAGAGVATGGVFAGYGLATMAAMKFGTSMAMGTLTTISVKGIDVMKKKSDLKFNEEQNNKREILKNLFASGKISQEEYEERIDIIEKEEIKRARNRMLLKAGVGIAIAGTAGHFAYDALGNGLSHFESTHDTINNINTPDNISHASIKPEMDTISGPDISNTKIIPNIIEHQSVEAVADNGQGAISTLRELQDKLKIEYKDNLNNAPESIKHILNTDAHKLAQEYGMYKPREDAESAFIKSGAIFKVDENGNLTYQEVGSDKSIILESGNPNIAEADYSGKMSDTDHSGVQIENNNIQEPANEYKLPEQVNPDTGELVGDKNIDINNLKPETENQNYANFLTEEQKVINETYIENINHLFPTEKLMGEWDYVKNNISAEKLMEMAKDKEVKPEFKSLIKYIKKLERITDLRPVGESVINPNPESITHFISRALERAQEIGKLDRVKL